VAKVFNVTTGESAAWALGADGVLTRLDPGTGRPAGDPVQTGRGTDVAAGLGYVWVTSDNGTVIRFDPKTGAEVGVPIKVGREPTAIAVGAGAAWVAASGDGAVFKITP
jgi:DNA-binding beta-propeller fold protein YncE